jgi:hypothetical protein
MFSLLSMLMQLDPNPEEPKKTTRIHANPDPDLKSGFVICIALLIILAALDFLETVVYIYCIESLRLPPYSP